MRKKRKRYTLGSYRYFHVEVVSSRLYDDVDDDGNDSVTVIKNHGCHFLKLALLQL